VSPLAQPNPASVASGRFEAQVGITERLMGGGNIRRVQARSCSEGIHGFVIPHDEIEYADEELGIAGGAAQCLRAKSGFGQKPTEQFGVAADKRNRLNRNDFSSFPRVLQRFLQWF